MTPDASDAATRLRDMNAALLDWDSIRQEGERISREEAYQVLSAEIASLRADNERRREEARRLTQQDDAREDPMAWLAFATDGSESNAVYSTDGEAQAAADAWGWQILPLYLAPRLTDAEREAVRFCVTASLPETQKLGGVVAGLCRMHTATLRGLLKRLSGDGDYPAADNAAMRDNALRLLAELDEELGLPCTPAECTVPPQCTEDVKK